MSKQKNPTISVVMTVYNGERFLAESIKSVLNQTFQDFELIIVNDGSTDKTEEIIKDFMKKDKRIVYIRSGKNKGYENLHNIMNIGLKSARGKYIARLDADDICYKNRLEIQHKYLQKHPKIFMLGSSAEVIDKNGKKIDEMIKNLGPSIMLKLAIGFNNPFIHSSIMFRNEGLLYPSYVEYFFFTQALISGKRLKNLKRKLVKYRINPEGITARNSKINKYKNYY